MGSSFTNLAVSPWRNEGCWFCLFFLGFVFILFYFVFYWACSVWLSWSVKLQKKKWTHLALQMSCAGPSEIKLGSKSVNAGLAVSGVSLGGKKDHPNSNLFLVVATHDLNSACLGSSNKCTFFLYWIDLHLWLNLTSKIDCEKVFMAHLS